MSKLLSDLQRLLAPASSMVQGKVVRIDLDVLFVSSPNGPKQFQVANPGTYRIGDRVRFQGDVLVGKLADEAGVVAWRV